MADDTTSTMKDVCCLLLDNMLFLALWLTFSAYIYPNDEQELDRLDMQHHLIKMVNGGRLFFAPLEHPKRILDIGTGSGIWPIEMGKYFHPFLHAIFERSLTIFALHSAHLPRSRDYRHRSFTRATKRSSRKRSLSCG